MMTPEIARSSFVVPACVRLGLYSLQTETLLMGTAAVESAFRFFIQAGAGPARGMFQMEIATFDWLYDTYLNDKSHKRLKKIIDSFSKQGRPTADELIDNHLLAAGMARIRYYAVAAPIPASPDEQSVYWWIHYNGRSPHGLKPADYVARWNLLCAPLYRHSMTAQSSLQGAGHSAH
ncbi:MAG: hypothetical protein ACYCZB_04865 [Acidiphilium sp.]